MPEMESRRIIEALRSGVPSRAVGSYFTEARPKLMARMDSALKQTSREGKSHGMIIKGRYGEGKTHLLNTVLSMAHAENMVVSIIPISKEIPMNKLFLVYQKLMQNTYLPNRNQPGFMTDVDSRLKDTEFANDLLLYVNTELQRNRISYVLRAYINENRTEEKMKLQADFEGDFLTDAEVKRLFRQNYKTPAKFTESFVKSRHAMDYFRFISYLFERMGYKGWVILFDEAELTGRLGKKQRMAAYENMAQFLINPVMNSTFTLLAFTESYDDDVIEGKHDFDILEELYPDQPEPIRTVLNMILKAPTLIPLSNSEIHEILEGIIALHGEGYGWDPGINADLLACRISGAGYLLRTKLRAAIEYLDQRFQYGDDSDIESGTLDEEDIVSLDAMDED